MTNTNEIPSERTRGFARCPHCNELIDASSVTCRFCKGHINTEELAAAALLQKKLIEAKSQANDRSAFRVTLRAMITLIVIAILYMLIKLSPR